MINISDKKIKSISVCKNGIWHEYSPVVHCVDCYKRNSELCLATIKGHTTICSDGLITEEKDFYLTLLNSDGYCSEGKVKEE